MIFIKVCLLLFIIIKIPLRDKVFLCTPTSIFRFTRDLQGFKFKFLQVSATPSLKLTEQWWTSRSIMFNHVQLSSHIFIKQFMFNYRDSFNPVNSQFKKVSIFMRSLFSLAWNMYLKLNSSWRFCDQNFAIIKVLWSQWMFSSLTWYTIVKPSSTVRVGTWVYKSVVRLRGSRSKAPRQKSRRYKSPKKPVAGLFF